MLSFVRSGFQTPMEEIMCDYYCGPVYWLAATTPLRKPGGASVRFESVSRLCAAKVALPVMTQSRPVSVSLRQALRRLESPSPIASDGLLNGAKYDELRVLMA